jgi:protein SCO1/2
MKKQIISILALSLLSVVVSNMIMAQEEELGIYEKLDQFIPEDLTFVSETGDTVNLLSLVDKPTVLVPVYYNCPGICTPLLEGVADVIDKTDPVLGIDYQFFTFSFNYEETTELAVKKKATFSKLVKGNHDLENGWKFFTSDSVNVHRLLNSIGYKVKKQGKEYVHPGAIVVLSPEGKITRYLHGTYIMPFDLKMAIVEASEGRSGPTINKFLKFCFSYDADGKKYVLNITKISGSIIIFLAVMLFLTLLLKKNRRKQTNELQ